MKREMTAVRASSASPGHSARSFSVDDWCPRRKVNVGGTVLKLVCWRETLLKPQILQSEKLPPDRSGRWAWGSSVASLLSQTKA